MYTNHYQSSKHSSGPKPCGDYKSIRLPRHDCTRSFEAFLEVGNGGCDANREHEKSQPPPCQHQYMPVMAINYQWDNANAIERIL